ncbi:MAG: hypothetical protein N2482_02775 [Patescibacteria group bacterium]|nr:hypothetical protein [Patescibacteria group bacterium]
MIEKFKEAETIDYREKLNELIYKLMKGRKIKMGYKEVIYHYYLKK